jgi:hypothetical protein
MYKLRWKKGNRQMISSKTFRTKSTAMKKAVSLRQLDDDLPKSQREKWLKTVRVVKVPVQRKIPKR